MPRPIKFYGKKRGDRRTGSKQVGRAGLGVFSAIFLAAGFLTLSFVLFGLSIPEWRVNHVFVETTATVLRTRVGKTDDGQAFRPEIKIQYAAGERKLTAWSHYDITGVYRGDPAYSAEILERFAVERQYPCWYDPRDPQSVVLARGYSWFAWLMLLLPAAFITLGGGGLVYVILTWGKSSERLAAHQQHPAGLDFFQPGPAPRVEFPAVPAADDLTNSPGTTLAYRLPTTSTGWSLFAALLFCLTWNGIVAIFVTMAVRGHLRGDPDWLLTAFVVPFCLVGLGAVWFVVRQIMITTGIGPTMVEISAHPLFPGSEYEILVSQSGRLTFTALRVQLVCEEVATYRQGTNTRTAARNVYQQQVLLREEFEVQPGMAFEARAKLRIPEEAMHSFKANHNRVDWKLTIEGQIARWPDFHRDFPLVVCPAGEGRAA